MKGFELLKSGLLFGFGISIAVIVSTIVYAAIWNTWTSPSSYETTSGSVLSSASWNWVLADVANLNTRSVPTGAVMAFYGTICPNDWSPADGTINGVKKTDGASATLDLRGEFIRGLDAAWVGARWVDGGRSLGSWQKPSITTYHSDGNATPYINSPMDMGTNANSTYWVEDANMNGYSSVGLTRTEGTAFGSYTPGAWSNNAFFKALRPRNIALLYCVKD